MLDYKDNFDKIIKFIGKFRVIIYIMGLVPIYFSGNYLMLIIKKIVTNPSYFNNFNIQMILVITYILTIFIFEIYLILGDKIKKYEFLLLAGIILFFLLLNLAYQFRIYPSVGNDVSEYSRCGYLISQGKTPYLDFFEHHNTFYCYLISPIFKLFPNLYSVYLLFIISWTLFILSSILIFKISKIYFKETRWALWSVLAFVGFKYAFVSYEVRPDIVVFFILLSSFYLFIRSDLVKNYFLIGLLMGIAFLFSQKTLFFIPLFLLAILLKSKRFKENIKKDLFYCFGLSIPVFIFLLFLLSHGLEYFKLYYFLNFTFNNELIWRGSFTYILPHIIIANGLTLILFLIGIPVLIRDIKTRVADKKIVAVLVMNILFIIFLLSKNRLMSNDPLYMFPLISILSVSALRYLDNKIYSKIKSGFLFLFIILFFLPAILNIFVFMYSHPNQSPLINFYLDDYKGERSNCNFIFNPSTQYHDFFISNQTINLMKGYGVESDYLNEEDLIKGNIPIICTKRTDYELKKLFIESNYSKYDIQDYYGRDYYYRRTD